MFGLEYVLTNSAVEYGTLRAFARKVVRNSQVLSISGRGDKTIAHGPLRAAGQLCPLNDLRRS